MNTSNLFPDFLTHYVVAIDPFIHDVVVAAHLSSGFFGPYRNLRLEWSQLHRFLLHFILLDLFAKFSVFGQPTASHGHQARRSRNPFCLPNFQTLFELHSFHSCASPPFPPPIYVSIVCDGRCPISCSLLLCSSTM